MANPLTFVMPLKTGVDLGELQQALDGQQTAIDDALASIGTVHYARFVLFDASSPNLQPKPGGTGPFSLSVITSYDGDFDVYIQDFVNKLGAVFNVLMSFSADGGGLVPVADNVEAFAAYIAANNASQQPPNSGFGLYNAYPYTVQQILATGPA
jgi:hypothetical protein